MCWMFLVTGKNWALGRRKINTTQSTTVYKLDAPASQAIDGNTDGNFYHHSCSKTTEDSSSHSWWSVTFEELIEIEAVVITNRADCCGELYNYILII